MAEDAASAGPPDVRLRRRLRLAWARAWLRLGGLGPLGRAAMGLAALGAPPYHGRQRLADLLPDRYYVAWSAELRREALRLEPNTYLGDRVTVYQSAGGGRVSLKRGARIERDSIIQTGSGGWVEIGERTGIQPRCLLAAYLSPIRIGRYVQIAAHCCVYSYNHGTEPGREMALQPFTTKGEVVIEDDVWLGAGVIVLSGVTIGHGAVIGAGSVVARDVPPDSIAIGAPARVVGVRGSHGAAAALAGAGAR